MQLNQARTFAHVQTHGGSKAFPHLTPIQELRRSVLACLLWEDSFYESGQSIGDRIIALSAKVSPADLSALAIQARTDHNLRHVSLLLAVELAKRGGPVVSATIERVIQRADEVAEFLTLYWRNGKAPIAKQVKKGLASALRKFDAYQLAKYDREKAIRLRDVLFMVHAKPKDEAQAAIWKQLVDGTLPTPDTWETNLSGGADKRETFERLIRENNLGYLALLRNLRNMTDSGVDETLIREALLARKGAQRVLPFRYVAAARACPRLEPTIDLALQAAIRELPALPGKTVVMVDLSGSMFGPKVSEKSDIDRATAAATLAAVLNAEDLRVFGFADSVVEVPPRRGLAGVDAILSATRGGTRLFDAIAAVNQRVPYDRLIVITDEQDTGGTVRSCPNPVTKGYMVNVASYKNGVGYGAWTHLDGFSEGIIRWIIESERDA